MAKIAERRRYERRIVNVCTVGGDRAKEILRRVMPYLIVKAEAAEKAVMS